MNYPLLVFEDGDIEIIACAPTRFRLLWKGKLVGTFKYYTWAVKYMDLELTPPP